MSSWLKRVAAAYKMKLGAFLEQLGTTETDPATFDWAARSADMDLVAAALGTDKSNLVQRSFAGIPKAGLMFVSLGAPAKSCPSCKAEFAQRGLGGIVLHRWKIAVAQVCGRCGGALRAALHPRKESPQNPLRSNSHSEVRDDVFNIVAMTMYDHAEAPVVERLFRAISTPISWRPPRGSLPCCAVMKNGPAIMWRTWNRGKTGIERTVPCGLVKRNFAAWPESAQIIAAATIKQLAYGPAGEWSDLRRMGLIEIGDTTIARRLFKG
jgi:hypothetical protein